MADTDRIELRGLRVMSVIGILPAERDAAQPIEIDLDLVVDVAAAAASDDVSDTVDYGAVTDAVATLAVGPFDLLERLADAVAEAALGFDGVTSVEVAVRKLRPPVPHDLATAGVRIVR